MKIQKNPIRKYDKLTDEWQSSTILTLKQHVDWFEVPCFFTINNNYNVQRAKSCFLSKIFLQM